LREEEIKRLEARIGELPGGQEALRAMRASGHYSWWSRWGWWMLGGGIASTVLVLLIILIIILLAL
jgi:hypothetical protein